MIRDVSLNTKAILLLTAPLLTGKSAVSNDLLTPGEYNDLALKLQENNSQPADLLSRNVQQLLENCGTNFNQERLLRLLGRGIQLSQAVERWQTRAIWVISRADAEYPQRIKERLKGNSPAILYGCGNMELLDAGGLAVVGSRHVDDDLVEYTLHIGHLAARAGHNIISGAAKGIDQAAMRGALEAGGQAVGVMSDGLERAIMTREHRDLILESRLVLVSPYDPASGFNVGNAMQRNKVIYALADAALVVNADYNKGGTWAGAIEQINKYNCVPVYVRSQGEKSKGLDALRSKGALPWPNPKDEDSFAAVFSPDSHNHIVQDELPFHAAKTNINATQSSTTETHRADIFVKEESHSTYSKDNTSASVLFDTARNLILNILTQKPRKAAEIAAELGISKRQADVWMKKLVNEGDIELLNKSVYRIVSQHGLFDKGRTRNRD